MKQVMNSIVILVIIAAAVFGMTIDEVTFPEFLLVGILCIIAQILNEKK